jgi:hypothetical protein
MPFFQRQLRNHGFVQIAHGRDQGAYYHDLFLRGQPNLLPLLNKARALSALKLKDAQTKTAPRSSGHSLHVIPSEIKIPVTSRAISPLRKSQMIEIQSPKDVGQDVGNPKVSCLGDTTSLETKSGVPVKPTRAPPTLVFGHIPDSSKRVKAMPRKWQLPVVTKPISTELVHHNWADQKPAAKDSV